MAIASAAVDVIVEENLVENAAKMGKIFADRLSEVGDSPLLNEYRWIGLFHAFDFNLSKLSHDPTHFIKCLRDNNVLTRVNAGNVVRFFPPLTINEE